MKLRNLLALLLTLVMLVSVFTACSTTEEDPGSSATGDVTPSAAGNDDDGNDELVTVELWWAAYGNSGFNTGEDAMEEAFNAITEEKIGVHVNFNWVSLSDYVTQLTLAVSNQEQVDILSIFPGNYVKLQASGCLYDMTDVAHSVGQETLDLLGEKLVNGTSIDGRIYGLSAYRNMNTNQYIIFREDFLEEVGMVDFVRNEMKTWDDYETVMAALTKDGRYGLGCGFGSSGVSITSTNTVYFDSANISDAYVFDQLGDTIGLIYTSQATREVANYWEMEEFVTNCKMLRKWYDAGYIWPDGMYSTDAVEQCCSIGVISSFFVGSEYGVEANKGQTVQHPVVAYEVASGVVGTSNARHFSMGIGASTKEPEAAMKVINLLYTDPDLMAVWVYGIEGENYVLDDDGVAHYPEGTDSSSCGYHGFAFWGGNQFLLPPWDTEGAGFYEGSLADFKNATISVFSGLSADISDMDATITNIVSVRDEFGAQLRAGQYTDEMYEEFISKLKAAGVDDYVQLYVDAASDFFA